MSRSSLAALGVLLLFGCAERTPTFREAQVLGGERVSAETLERGFGLYGRHCATCHGATGAGDGPRAAGLDPAPADLQAGRFEHTDGAGPPTREAIAAVLRDGVEGTAMAPQRMRPDDLSAIAAYVMTLSPLFAEERGAEERGAEERGAENSASERP